MSHWHRLRKVPSKVAALAERMLRDAFGIRPSEVEIIAGLQGLPTRRAVTYALEKFRPTNTWHSWDPAPWKHPWLTRENLRALSAFQKTLFEKIRVEGCEEAARTLRYGFVGNIANNMAMRAFPLRREGYKIDIILHPHDRYLMSQPGWEISEAVPPEGETDIDCLINAGFLLPDVEGVVETTPTNDTSDLITTARTTNAREWSNCYSAGRYIKQGDVLLWPQYMCFMPTFQVLQRYDALLAAQAPYLAYLSGRPYLAAQTGGDLWFEAARNDALGLLQRHSYANASAILATNPWAFAHARRYGFNHVLYVPLLIDTSMYSPGQSTARAEWQAKVGGSFFVLATARLDQMWKGTDIGLNGYLRFASANPEARLVVLGWGKHKDDLWRELLRCGLGERAVLLPICGKRKIIDYLRAADCLLDQFKFGYYGATALEAMACGAPVIMKLWSEQYDALCPTGAPPVLNSASSDEVADALRRLATSQSFRKEIGERSRRWIEANHSVSIWGQHYGALLYAVARGRKFDFSSSPLAAPRRLEEVTYHRDSLAAAPPFPQYII